MILLFLLQNKQKKRRESPPLEEQHKDLHRSVKVCKESTPVGSRAWKGRPTVKEFAQVSLGSEQQVLAFSLLFICKLVLPHTMGSGKPRSKHLDGKHRTLASFNNVFSTLFFHYWFQVFETKRKISPPSRAATFLRGKTVPIPEGCFLLYHRVASGGNRTWRTHISLCKCWNCYQQWPKYLFYCCK